MSYQNEERQAVASIHHRFTGELTSADAKHYIQHTFEVPPNYAWIDIRLQFSPPQVYGILNMLCLSLFDPDGFRGAGHRHGSVHQVHLNLTEATPGYRAGPLPPGVWTVEIDVHMIMPDELCRYSLDVSYGLIPNSAKVIAGNSSGRIPSPLILEPGWYRGDLHTHTTHSDAEWDVAGLLAAAKQQGLDFVTLTDHNTISGLEEMERVNYEGLLTMGGMELTTFWGHALCLGTRQWTDWRVDAEGRQMANIARECYENGQVFIIAHPCCVGDPYCTGCKWVYPQMQPGNSQLVEVWNGPWSGECNNELALAQWYEWLNQGHHLVATAGTDAHHPGDYAATPVFSVVYAEALSETAILQALKLGHLYLSTGPRLTFFAETERGIIARMGGEARGGSISFTVAWAECPSPATIRIVQNGEVVWEKIASKGGEHQWTHIADTPSWWVVEIRNENGEMLALTNPIYVLPDEGALPSAVL